MVSFSMDQQRDNGDLVLLRGLGCRGNVMRGRAGEDWKWIVSRKGTNNEKKKKKGSDERGWPETRT